MHTPKKIAVAGATGRLGHHVVDVLKERGHQVVPMSRTFGVDLITGDGLADALTDVEVVIDAASGPEAEQDAATAFFTTSAGNLHDHGHRAGVQKMVLISIIGTDRFRVGYNAAKAAHERAHRAGPIPVTVLRAAQFHEFVAQLVDWGTQGDVGYVQNMRTQLVAARTVAEVAADLATGIRPAEATHVEVAGPQEERLADAATLLAGRRGHPVKIEEVSNAADPDRELYETGALLPGPGAIVAGPTYEEWLDETR